MAQREHLLVLRDYLAWMSNAKNAEITLTYQNLVDLLEQTAIEYDVLVNMLQKQVNQNRDTAK